MLKCVAFFRGINVGGNKKVPMADLKKVLEKMGLKNVKTLLNSGNVIFETAQTDAQKLAKKIEAVLEDTFGFPIPTIVRPEADLKKLLKSDPFKKIKVTADTRLYVTFLSEKPRSTLKVPYESSDKAFRILKVSDGEVCSVLTLTPKAGTTDAMKILEKEFGKNITTRNWNTVEKIFQ